jgi:hypothetical protein
MTRIFVVFRKLSNSARAALILLLVLSFLGVPIGTAWARDETLTKAQFVHNLALYVDWPNSSFRSPNSAFRFCTIDAEDVASALLWVSTGKKVKGRSVEVMEISQISQAKSCQLVYTGEQSKAKLREIASDLSGHQVLSVADSETFAEFGGVIGFKMVRGKIQFTINSMAVGREDLKVNDKLMKLGNVL